MSGCQNKPNDSQAQKDLDERITDLENLNCERRLLQLESERIAQQLDPKVWVFVNERLDNLEKNISRYHELVLGACPIDIEKNIRVNIKGKAPHKCPVCGGNGLKWDITDNQGLPWPTSQKIDCRSCAGKGIVWEQNE